MACKNTTSNKINLTHPCNPCNACSSCSRCACECTCNLPDYCNEGCLTIVPSDCITFSGDTIGSITKGMTLTNVITQLASGVSEPVQLMSNFSVQDQSLDGSFEAVSERITRLSDRLDNKDHDLLKEINKKIGFNEVEISDEDAIKLSYSEDKFRSEIDYEILFNNLVNYIKSNEISTNKFGQLISYINNPTNFINAPFQVFAIPSITTTLVNWSEIPEASSYDVYKRPYAEGNFEKVGNTTSLGLTVSGLEPNKVYEYYVISVDASLNKSIPSKITNAKTLSLTV